MFEQRGEHAPDADLRRSDFALQLSGPPDSQARIRRQQWQTIERGRAEWRRFQWARVLTLKRREQAVVFHAKMA
jgi:hypothetical protein